MVVGWAGPILFKKSSTVAAGAASADVMSTSLNGVLADEALVDWGEGVRGAKVFSFLPFRDAMTALRASSSRRRCCSMSSRLGLPETGIVGVMDVGLEGMPVCLSALGWSGCVREAGVVTSSFSTGV